MAKSTLFLGLAVIIGLIGVFWPQIEELIFQKCPVTFFGLREPRTGGTTDVGEDYLTKVFSLHELNQFDGSDPAQPIYLAVGGIVLDVSSGRKFYEKGAGYSQFAGQACTRALVIASLEKKDISDDTADFTPAQEKEMEETLKFYYGKYPKVGVLEKKRFPELD
ncbi:Aste57867_13255 [Aphanomyces stellatus]|uniref:Aste57867_13255 protein n=1 Tax=Aphanomyces stellatus TaxID=120398 RepID=A0A485KXY3_9STRA|nr:hypothetical protein As57867_013206 [Aphanomyces stellatus]VFT90095.1 Aste57867_13255 [Aphanomyces stellatus]